MKDENTKLLLGLGLGALVGVAVGYYLHADSRKKLGEDIHKVTDGVKSVYSKVKDKVEKDHSSAETSEG